MFKGLDAFEARDESSFRNWVARCVEREIIDTERRRTSVKRGRGEVKRFGDLRASGLLSGAFAAEIPTPSEDFEARESEERLETALLGLKKNYRELLVQRHLCGASYAAIARDLEVDESTVRQACRRAETKLKTALSEGWTHWGRSGPPARAISRKDASTAAPAGSHE